MYNIMQKFKLISQDWVIQVLKNLESHWLGPKLGMPECTLPDSNEKTKLVCTRQECLVTYKKKLHSLFIS